MSRKEDLIKSFYSLFSSYGLGEKQNNLITQFQKKGLEIKVGVNSLINNLNKQKADILDNMNSILEKIQFSPDNMCENYNEYKHLLDFHPKIFSWQLMSKGIEVIDSSKGVDVNTVNKPSEEDCEMMREYNKLVYEYLDYCVSKIKLEALRKNLEDNKQYILTIDQVTMLGL